MALRLTAAPSADDAQLTPLSGPLALVSRTRALLREGDLAAYDALFADAAALPGRDDRYRARSGLLEAALGAAGQVPASKLAGLFASVARGALGALEENAREPVLVNYLGVALYEVGALRAAESCFRAAERMDPTLPHLASNLEQVARRRGGGRLPLPAGVRAVLPELERRARRVAADGRPAEGMTLSLCMIVRDEEEMLPRCLAAARPAVDEIVVVDTGSQDRTREIALEYGARVLEFPWTGSFSEARNVSIEAATSDWWIFLDADEVLVEEDVPALRALTGRTWREAFFLPETSFTGDLEDGMAAQHNALRMFRNRPEYAFEGRLHEQVAHHLPNDLPERLEVSGARIEHYGYLGEVRQAKEKSQRNIELLERQLAESPPSAFLHFNLGSEYSAAGRPADSLREFRRAWGMLKGEPEMRLYGYMPSLVDRLVKLLRVNGELDEADRQAEEGLALLPGYTDLVAEQALAARQRGDLDRAVELLQRCLEMGDAPSHYSPTRGAGSYLALSMLAELRRDTGDLAEAERLLRECLRSHPGYLGAVLPLASVLLAREVEPERVVDEVCGAVAETTASVHFMLGTALYETGHAEAAVPRFRAVLARQPGNRAALVALAEADLTLCRFPEAVAIARDIEGDDALGHAARRAELFGLLAAETAGDAGDALARGRADGLPPEHLAAFAAWAAARAGRAPEETLPIAAAPLLGVVLEALLRVRELDRFGELVAVLDHVALAERERRELLAGIYLRRGFLESAADEWMAVCQGDGGPDARALIGLAQIAVANDLREDAVVFAEGVLELEPGHAGATALLGRLASSSAAGGR